MVDYTLAAATRSSRLDRVCVSTDDPAVAARARAWDVEVIDRPSRLAGDATPMIDAVLHSLDAVSPRIGDDDAVVLLQPTSPLRSHREIDLAVSQFLAAGRDSLLSVNRVSEHPCECVTVSGGRLRVAVRPPKPGRGRQSFPPYFFINGAIYITRVRMLRRRRRFWDERAAFYEMPRELSVDIDEPAHLALAEARLATLPAARRLKGR